MKDYETYLCHLKLKLVGVNRGRCLTSLLLVPEGWYDGLHHLLLGIRVFSAIGEEVHYFSQHFHQSLQWYLSLSASQPGQLRETSLLYIFHLAAPARIRSVLPGVRRLLCCVTLSNEPCLSIFMHVGLALNT